MEATLKAFIRAKLNSNKKSVWYDDEQSATLVRSLAHEGKASLIYEEMYSTGMGVLDDVNNMTIKTI